MLLTERIFQAVGLTGLGKPDQLSFCSSTKITETITISTLIKSSNQSVLIISLLENYTFLTNKIFSTKDKDKFITISHVYS